MIATVRPSRLRVAAPLVLLVAAIALTTAGLGLIAFSGTIRSTRLGIPISLWGGLLGYTAIRMSRAGVVSTESVPVGQASIGAAEPRASAELVRAHDEAVRREYTVRLEVMLRRELEQVLRTELAGLRRDVAELRGDVIDAVDGRLRMERVEITRITGSSLAARQEDGRTSLRAASADVTLPVPGPSREQRFPVMMAARLATARGSLLAGR